MIFAYAKTKVQNSFAVTVKLISAFVFATRIVQFLFFLNPKFHVSSHLMYLHRPVCVRPGRKPQRRFSHVTAHIEKDMDLELFVLSDKVMPLFTGICICFANQVLRVLCCSMLVSFCSKVTCSCIVVNYLTTFGKKL